MKPEYDDYDFAEFYRFMRQKQGTIAEFARKHGFNPTVISRIESGVRVPKTNESATSHAKALNLSPGTPRFERFMTLLFAETGRLGVSLRCLSKGEKRDLARYAMKLYTKAIKRLAKAL